MKTEEVKVLKRFSNWDLLSLSLVFFAFSIVFSNTLISIIEDWIRNHFSNGYGLFIFAIAVWMIWKRRRLLVRSPVKGDFIGGLFLTVLGSIMLVSGTFSSTLLLQKSSLIVSSLGLVWLLWDFGYLKVLFIPLCYLFFMFPFFEEFPDKYVFYLQLVTARLASSLIKLLGIPVFQHGQLIELPHATLNVIRACSGLNHIIAIIAITFPIAFATQESAFRRAIMFAMAPFIGIITNSVRIVGIGIWSYRVGGKVIHGPFDLLVSSFIFMVGIIVISTLGICMREKPLVQKMKEKDDLKRNNPVATQNRIKLSATVISILILFATAGWLHWMKPKPVFFKKNLSDIPLLIGPWVGRDVEVLGESFETMSPDITIKRVYYNALGDEIKMYVGYFAKQTQEKELVSYSYDWLHKDSEEIAINSDTTELVKIKRSKFNKANIATCAYFWYDINGRIIISRYRAKLVTIIDALMKRQTNGTIVIITKPGGKTHCCETNIETSFLKNILAIIKDYSKTQ